MVPQRFITEYPERRGLLLQMLEPQARKADLVGSLALLVASAAFTIPFTRLFEARHPLERAEPELSRAIKNLKRYDFLHAPFWEEERPAFFRYATITTDPEVAERWLDTNEAHPMRSTEQKDAGTVLLTIRRALAHGNVVYLDEQGHEMPGNQVRYLAFLSKHDDGKSHRVAIFGQEDFLLFLKAWISWLQTFPKERAFDFSEAAE